MRVIISLDKSFYLLLLSSLLMVLCLAGCGEDSSILDNGQSRQLEFSVITHNWSDFANSNKSSDQKVPSRATPISGNTFDTSKSFNVIADVNKGSNWSAEVKNEIASYSTENNIWQTSATHYWPGTGSVVNFYAYYPTSISSKVTHNAGSAPVLSYTVPDHATDQIDILASSKTGVAGDSYNQTPVDFKHIFAAVQFRVGSSGMINGTITKISLNGIQNTGSYSFTSGWTPQTSSTTTYTKNVSVASDAGTEIVSGNDPFLVMPQTLSNASFTVTYSGGATLTKSLSGIWEAGKVYDYNINSSFSATQDFSYTGDVQSYTVPFTGTYKLEVWGAQGQFSIADSVRFAAGGLGAQSSGIINLTKGQSIYIAVGGQGANTDLTDRDGGYNGGGNATWDHHYNDPGGSESCGSGGGCTSITLTNRGTLDNFSNFKSEVLIVAGGGGGGCWHTNGGAGGGTSGGAGGDSTIIGGTQTTGYAFGHGQPGTTTTDDASDGRPGGGGGWYGGYSKGCDTTSGAGGSGYIGGVTNGSMQNGVRSGNGYAKITFVSAN